MKPYYEDGSVTIYHGDCREGLRGINGGADVVFTDPPYGIAYEAMREGHTRIASDGSPREALQVVGDVLRLAQAHTYFVCCDWRSMPTMLEAMRSVRVEPKACIV